MKEPGPVGKTPPSPVIGFFSSPSPPYGFEPVESLFIAVGEAFPASLRYSPSIKNSYEGRAETENKDKKDDPSLRFLMEREIKIRETSWKRNLPWHTASG